MTIAKKLLLGYLPALLLTTLVASVTLVSLNRINRITGSIVEVDVPLVEAADHLVDHLLAQDSYGRRYLLLQDPGLAEVFRQRSEGVQSSLARFREFRGRDDPWTASVEGLHGEYVRLFEEGFLRGGELSPDEDRALRGKHGELLEAVRRESGELRRARNRKTLHTSELGARAFRITVVLCLLGALGAGGTAVLIARGITGALRRLKAATAEISEGHFDRVPELLTGDELEDFARALAAMSSRLRRMEQMCLDASPLTRLPGGEAIEEALRRRIEEGEPVVFCLFDMDNFKAYSDRYGYARGSEVIKAVARILEETVEALGRLEDFVGHIGGDDFVLLTAGDRFRGLCTEVLRRFDAEAPSFYDPEDRERGFLRGVDRRGEPATFPLLSLSVAVVTEPSAAGADPVSVGEAAARLKERAKAIPGSVCVVDREWKEEA